METLFLVLAVLIFVGLAGLVFRIFTFATEARRESDRLDEKVKKMTIEEVRALLNISVPKPSSITPEEEIEPVDGTKLHSPRMWKDWKIIGYLHEIEHDGTPLFYIAVQGSQIVCIDAVSEEIVSDFPTLEHLILREKLNYEDQS